MLVFVIDSRPVLMGGERALEDHWVFKKKKDSDYVDVVEFLLDLCMCLRRKFCVFGRQ